MTPPTQEAADQVRRLQGCINDLISMLALPALWKGSEPPDIIGALLDGLVRMLGLEFAQARVFQCPGAVPMDIVRPKGSALGQASALATATFKLGHSTDFIGLASLAGEMLFLNAAGQDLAGMESEGEARAASALDFVASEDRERVRTHLWPVVLRSGPWDGELRFRNLHTSMGELIASNAHEVNEPLADVVTNADACLHGLAAHPCNFEEAHAAAKRIIRDANRASEVISRIRSFLSRGNAHHAPLHVGEAIRDIAGIVHGEARAKRVKLLAAADASLPPVIGERVQLRQVRLNLAMNGIEAMGEVNGRERILEIGARLEHAGEVRVYVRDSGPGLDAAQREHVFDAFYTTKPHGMGMGLAISRSIIENHGGRLWSERNREHGETFQFTLPTPESMAP